MRKEIFSISGGWEYFIKNLKYLEVDDIEFIIDRKINFPKPKGENDPIDPDDYNGWNDDVLISIKYNRNGKKFESITREVK